MERRLGFKVFHRKRNTWQLTPEGQELYNTGNMLFDQIEKSFKTIEQLRTGSVGKISVGTECYSFYHGLPAFIQKMAVLYPDIEVKLNLEATHHPNSKLLSNEIDIAMVTKKPKNDKLTSIPVYEDELFGILHKEHPLSKKDFLEASDFTEAPLIIHSYPLETVAVYNQFLQPNGITPTKISAIPLTEVALEMVEANMGILCMPKWALSSFKFSGDLIFKGLGPQGLKRTHYVVVRKEDQHKTYLQDFIATFEENFSMV
ncbi:selenium metabolism-associated LysR family transcriptional regulator [Gangjinia marincola]|uniref:Selenium metabolism-associated LysR family transcriptional regulator n=1 Tax=Gangjinia marincola TaxID=578463 RepID=A0ABP3XU02_9FLAO